MYQNRLNPFFFIPTVISLQVLLFWVSVHCVFSQINWLPLAYEEITSSQHLSIFHTLSVTPSFRCRIIGLVSVLISVRRTFPCDRQLFTSVGQSSYIILRGELLSPLPARCCYQDQSRSTAQYCTAMLIFIVLSRLRHLLICYRFPHPFRIFCL